MAIIKLGAVVVGIRGTVGGITFSANGAGPYAKQWVMPTLPNSPKQDAQKNILGSMPNAWRSLNVLQLIAWQNFAAAPAQVLVNSLGELYSLNGYQWFVKINTWRNTVGQGILSNAPTLAKPAAPTITSYVVQETGPVAQITYPGGTFSASQYVVVFGSVWSSTTKLTPPNNRRFLRAQLNPGASPFTFPTEYVATFGNPIPNTRAFAHVYRQNSEGYRSAPTIVPAFIT